MKNITIVLSLLLVTSCANRTRTRVLKPERLTRMQRLIKCTKEMIKEDVNPLEASNICERFLNSRRK